jgi:hypothetical protein
VAGGIHDRIIAGCCRPHPVLSPERWTGGDLSAGAAAGRAGARGSRQVGAGQTLIDTWRLGDIKVVELDYEHEAERWWQSHWRIPYGGQGILILTAQAPTREVTATRAAAELVATSVTPAPG